MKVWNFRTALRTALLLLAAVLTAHGSDAGVEKIFFSREFPGSVPEYFEVLVDSNGRVKYREFKDEDPVEFQISAQMRDKIFGLAAELNYFQAPIESKRKVAFTGEKTFRYVSADGEAFETSFNYTRSEAANALVEWFQKVSETERHLLELARTARFDRLGVNDALLQFQISYDNGRIIAPEQFLPILKQIAHEKRYLQIARSRAGSLAERIELKR